MKQNVKLIPAPTSIQPGGYVSRAHPDRSEARTPRVELQLESGSGDHPTWEITLRWPCPEPVRTTTGDTDQFPDAAAVLAPAGENVSWMTMGAPGAGVEGILWRADADALIRVTAEGLGTVARHDPAKGWGAEAAWRDESWELRIRLDSWPLLAQHRQIALAVWRGAEQERAGLKSVSPGWLEVPR